MKRMAINYSRKFPDHRIAIDTSEYKAAKANPMKNFHVQLLV